MLERVTSVANIPHITMVLRPQPLTHHPKQQRIRPCAGAAAAGPAPRRRLRAVGAVAPRAWLQLLLPVPFLPLVEDVHRLWRCEGCWELKWSDVYWMQNMSLLACLLAWQAIRRRRPSHWASSLGRLIERCVQEGDRPGQAHDWHPSVMHAEGHRFAM